MKFRYTRLHRYALWSGDLQYYRLWHCVRTDGSRVRESDVCQYMVNLRYYLRAARYL